MATTADPASEQRRTPRTLQQAITAAVDEARDAGRLSPADEPLVSLAKKLATQVSREKRTADVVRLARELRVLLADLPLRAESGSGGGDGGADDEPGKPTGIDAELAELVGSGPTVGNASLS